MLGSQGSNEPAKDGFYSILLFAPMHTTIQAHSHRDDRIATVVSGEMVAAIFRNRAPRYWKAEKADIAQRCQCPQRRFA